MAIQQQNDCRKLESEISEKIKTMQNQIKQQEKKLDDIIKSCSGFEEQTYIDVSDIKNHLDVLTQSVFGKELYMHDFSAKDIKNSVIQVLEKTREDVRKIDTQTNEVATVCSNLRETLDEQFSKLHVKNKDITDKLKDIETRVCKPYMCQIHLANNTPVTAGSILSTFKVVWEFNGKHFDKKTGQLVAPDDGLYLVIVTLEENADKLIKVSVVKGDKFKKEIFVKSTNTSACGSTIVDMKRGEKLYFKVDLADEGAMLHSPSGMTFVRL
ncbi:uncharacterized protein LOC131947332 [Physella acuta]|uniref:uncharacterized protein LOC131947332 n=1 Tax=Physella acuta TaxID=109671 RepID=UPI0027DE388A|nr:uncharacterized protein LOC131947332 [Physella acuta]